MLDKIFFVGLDLLAIVLPVSIAATNIVFFPLAALWLFGAHWTFRRWAPVWGAPEVFFLVYLGVSLLSAVCGLDPAHSLKEIKNKDFYILISVVLVALVRSPEKNARLLKLFMAAALGTAVWGLIQYGAGVSMTDKAADGYFLNLPKALAPWPRSLLTLLTMINGRVEGTRGHPLAYAECLLFNWSFAICFLLGGLGRKGFLWAAYLVVTGAALLVSQSRGPWIAAAVIALVAMITTSGRRRWLMLGVGALFIVLFATVPFLKARAVSILDRSNNSNKERIHMWRAGFEMWKTHPLLGVGPGNVKGISVSYQTPDEKVWGPWGHLHSIYVNTLVERGVVGFLSLFLFLGSIGYELWSAMRRTQDPQRQAIFKAGLLGMMGFLLGGMTETSYNTAVVMMTFYFVSGLALALSRHIE